MINTERHGIKELDSSDLSTLSQLANLNTNADLIDKAIDHWGTASWSGSILNVTSEIPSQELYTGLSISFMLTATNLGDASIKLDSLDEKSLLNSTGSVMSAGSLTAGQIYTVTYDGTAFRINNIEHATSADSATFATNADTVDGMHAADFATAAQGAKADVALPMSGYTAADILSKIKTVDGAGSGLDADTLDGLDSMAFATAAQGAKADAALPMSGYTAADILTKIKTVDGAGSGLDADTIDGLDSTAFATVSDLAFQKAGGSATAITLTTAAITDGYSKTFVASADNNGAATTINGLPLYKPNTTTAPSLIAGKAYTIWYNAAGSCFFVKASAEGTATASDVLAGRTFSNDDDTGLTGTITTKTSSDLTVSGAAVTVPAGYYASGASKSVTDATQATPTISVSTGGLITATATQTEGYVSAGTKSATEQMAVKAAQTYTPSKAAQTISAGQYLSGDQTISGDANLVAENIVSGISIFGVSGSAIIRKYASGIGSASSKGIFTVCGLTFQPVIIVCEVITSPWYDTAYSVARAVYRDISLGNSTDANNLNCGALNVHASYNSGPTFNYYGLVNAASWNVSSTGFSGGLPAVVEDTSTNGYCYFSWYAFG